MDTVFADFNLSTSTMTVTYYSTSPEYGVIGTHQFSFSMTNNVRNELNHQRENPDVTTTPLQGNANWYYPRQFPIGLWKIGQSIPKDGTDPYLGDVFIPTDAHQEVPVYGDATSPMPEKKDGELPNSNGTQEDTAYGFHYSASSTTLGCGKGDTQETIEYEYKMQLNSRRLTDGEYFAAFLKLDEIRKSNPNAQGNSDEMIGRQLNKSARQVCKMREIAKLELGELNLSDEDVDRISQRFGIA